MQLALRLPSLPHVHGRNDPLRLAQRWERPAEGPHKGGALHLRDKVCINVQFNIRAVNDDGMLIVDAKDVSKAFGGRVTLG